VATARVLIDYGEAEVTVEVIDTGTGAASGVGGGRAHERTAGGQGIAGMRERVTALGGDFAAGPRPTGGFRVFAWLPAEPRK
jgi:signal transduction histidine kinase